MQRPQWGQTFPSMTLLAVIGELRAAKWVVWSNVRVDDGDLDRYLVRHHQSDRVWVVNRGVLPRLCGVQVPVYLGGKSSEGGVRYCRNRC
jgi:hypothetical protein